MLTCFRGTKQILGPSHPFTCWKLMKIHGHWWNIDEDHGDAPKNSKLFFKSRWQIWKNHSNFLALERTMDGRIWVLLLYRPGWRVVCPKEIRKCAKPTTIRSQKPPHWGSRYISPNGSKQAHDQLHEHQVSRVHCGAVLITREYGG